jgi:hypothetical protein
LPPTSAAPEVTRVPRAGYDLVMRQLAHVVMRRQLHEKSGDAAHWLARPRAERVAAVELLRQRQHGWTDASRPRLQRVHRILERP